MRRAAAAALALALGCGAPASVPVEDVLKDLPRHLGQRVTIRTKLHSGARCRVGEGGEWQTYCKDCQYCRGPLVVAVSSTIAQGLDDWPLILGGTWENKDIRCKGPLHAIECHPFDLAKTYVVRGVIEHQRPAKLIVERFWEVRD